MRVLIIDDETLIRKSLVRVARSRGHTVRAEKDGERGLNTWRLFQPHLVFLDILMPKLDGPSVLKKAGKKNNEKVIMMSAHRAFSDGMPVRFGLSDRLFFYPKDKKKEENTNSIPKQYVSVPGVDLFISKPFQNVINMFNQVEQLCFHDKEFSL